MVTVGRAGFCFVGLFTCEYDSVETRFSPELHEMDHVPKSEGRVSSENHTRLSEVIAEVSMDAGVVLQLIGLNELEYVSKAHEEMLAYPGRKNHSMGE